MRKKKRACSQKNLIILLRNVRHIKFIYHYYARERDDDDEKNV